MAPAPIADDAAPMVSVCTITYNHERFIEQSVYSVLAQRCSFTVEQVIGDDASTDGTPRVLARLAQENPGRLRLFLRDRNIGMFANFTETFARCRGRYIALLEGDDYWTDPDKLAMQVDFLEKNPSVAVCFHRMRVVNDADGATFEDFPRHAASLSGIDDLLRGNFISTGSVVYRAGLVATLPPWAARLRSLDWLMHALHATRGDIAFLDRTMGVYRVHAGGVWTTLVPEKRFRSELEMLAQLDAHLGRKHHRPISDAMAARHFHLSHARADAGDLAGARRELAKMFWCRPQHWLMGRRALLKLVARLCPGMSRRLAGPTFPY